MLLYQAYTAQQTMFAPLRQLADVVRPLARGGRQAPSAVPSLLDFIHAACELVSESRFRHDRPEFGIATVTAGGKTVAVEEVSVLAKPFCRLVHFKKDSESAGPRVLLVAPLSGHFATLLRGTVAALLPDHDVYITDWVNARNIPLLHGSFNLDDYIDYLIDFIRLLGPEVHVIAVCQPAVPALAAVSILAADNDPQQPRSLVLMGGPIDTRANPTRVNEFAERHSIEYLKRAVVTRVPPPYPGFMRAVFPGFLQLSNFMNMNLDRHLRAHNNMFRNLVRGNDDDAAATRRFYDEYFTVMDLPAEFYLQTVHKVFKDHELPRGMMQSRDRPIRPGAIRRVALMTVEGAEDDICAPGQTYAAHALCTGIDGSRRSHHLEPATGHYGVFNGRHWREQIMPRIRDFIRANDAAPRGAARSRNGQARLAGGPG